VGIKVAEKHMRCANQKRHPLTGLIVGAISGLAGTVVMTQFQNLWNKVSDEMEKPKPEEEAKRADEKKKAQKEDSTMKAAGKISKQIGHPLSRNERKKAGPWVHYAFGTAVGAVFGLAAEMKPGTVRRFNPVLAGAGYGAAVFVAAHEILVPALKLSSNPLKEPIPNQIAEFVSHLIYGMGTALMYDSIERLER
jgi:putative membrane protein